MAFWTSASGSACHGFLDLSLWLSISRLSRPQPLAQHLMAFWTNAVSAHERPALRCMFKRWRGVMADVRHTARP
eukprot:365083-Chlamydomonas_euryale.AAC.25